jgi:hypothetical protein
MKKLLLALTAVLWCSPALAQSTLYSSSSSGSVGIGTSSPTAGAALDLSYETNSMLLPAGTTAQRPTGVAGMIRYNSSNSIPEVYISSWLPIPLTASSPVVINSTTGNISCPTCSTSADVTSVSGDGALISNSLSTGAVTLALGNAAAYSVWGNNTSSSATPSYTNSPTLSGSITDTQSIGATSTDGLVLTNPTAATLGNQEWSPRVRWTGQGWKTNSTASSQEVDAIAEIQPVQGATSPSFNWVLSGQINSGGYGPLLTIPSGGGLNLNSGTYQINGVQIAASNLQNGVTGSGAIVLATSPSLTTPSIGAATGTSLAVTGNITSSGGQVGVGTSSPTTGTALDLSYDTNSLALPVGTTAQRPSPINGMIRLNSSTPAVEAYYNGAWNSLGTGTASTADVQTFTSSGTWNPPGFGGTKTFAQCWGAGGSGAAVGSGNGGGGGGGGYMEAWYGTAALGTNVSVTIGAGGSGVVNPNNGNNGGNSTFSTITAYGGGGGTSSGGGGGGGSFSAGSGATAGSGSGGWGGGTTGVDSGTGGGGGAHAVAGGKSVWGGGGGGDSNGSSAGISLFGGSGGAGSSTSGTAGTTPSGGGGGCCSSGSGTSGSGGGGQCIITTFP